ncbi:MAG: fumarylacetoacetate hydrolase family protein [Crocinitomicaceae bacterium]|jgi:acylpyruvate hydrolase|nr:fumarylacetoacetate hydrolase family protein [Crocinitomicaceae bacterium]MBT6029656.1 fumarylacetoacetate hydrolase family protein [Crocinitomicaceae bacterium]MBT6513404.1 fumarylacetoacetate hydrolase family protein [Crocinitomicaceae bacterium]
MKIICIGRNYAEHAIELGNKVPKEPLFFLKPETALLPRRNPLFYPSFTSDLQYELEIVVKISRLGKNIQKKFAHKYYDEIGLGIDFTARDIQKQCKKDGHPWEKAKAFDGSAVIGNQYLAKDQLDNLNNLSFQLFKNGTVVQSGNTKDMIFKIDDLIEYVSQYFTLKIGDLIFTGTPVGVGPVQIDDKLEGFLENQKLVAVNIK